MIPAISSYASRPIAVSVLVCTKPNLQHCELHNMMAVALLSFRAVCYVAIGNRNRTLIWAWKTMKKSSYHKYIRGQNTCSRRSLRQYLLQNYSLLSRVKAGGECLFRPEVLQSLLCWRTSWKVLILVLIKNCYPWGACWSPEGWRCNLLQWLPSPGSTGRYCRPLVQPSLHPWFRVMDCYLILLPNLLCQRSCPSRFSIIIFLLLFVGVTGS